MLLIWGRESLCKLLYGLQDANLEGVSEVSLENNIRQRSWFSLGLRIKGPSYV